MVARTTLRRRFTAGSEGSCNQPVTRIEPLEGRTLLSAWGTVAMGGGYYGTVAAMTADASGNVYAVGFTTSANGVTTGMLWEKPAGGAWGALATVPGRFVGGGGVALDANGDVFITGAGGTNNNYFTTWELPQGASSVITLDTDTNGAGHGNALAVDGAGNLYAVGYDSLKIQGNSSHHWVVRKGTYANGKWNFSTVDEPQYKFLNDSANGVIVTSAGICVAGYFDYFWTVRFSPTGAGGTWTTVDSFRRDSTASAASQANAIGTDAAGRFYVAGFGQVAAKSGKSYTYATYWTVRESDSGAAGSWSTVDDAQSWLASDPATAYAHTAAKAVGRDSSGNIYIAGGPLIRTRPGAGGNWAISDLSGTSGGNTYYYSALTTDSLGNLYAGGEWTDAAGDVDDYVIRSLTTAPTSLTASPDAAMPSSQIDLSWVNAAGNDETGFAIYRSIDGVNFTLLTTLDASATHYGDSGLAAGTRYYYHVVALLNADGASAASATASTSTSS